MGGTRFWENIQNCFGGNIFGKKNSEGQNHLERFKRVLTVNINIKLDKKIYIVQYQTVQEYSDFSRMLGLLLIWKFITLLRGKFKVEL